MGCPHDPNARTACAACRAGAEGLRPTIDRVRYSRLKLMALSPAHYQAWVDKEGPALERGRGFHSMVLGGPEVIPYPGKVRNGREWEAFQAANDNKMILNRTDYALAAGMAEAVLRHPVAPKYLAGEREVEIDWSYLGRPCQSHIDVVGPGNGYVTELKSSVSASPRRFPTLAHRMNYAGQVAFYRAAVEAARGVLPREVYSVVVEQAPPHVVTVFRAEPDLLELGDKTIRSFMEQLLACEAANEWPGYAQDIVPWHAPEEDIQFTFGGGDGPDFDPTTGEVAA